MRTRPFAEPDARANGHSCTAGEDHGVFEELCFRFGIAFPLWPWLILIVGQDMSLALLIALLAVIFTFYQAWLSRHHNRLSVRPHLQWNHDRNWNDGGLDYRLFVENSGLGPARIRTIELFLNKKAFVAESEDPFSEIATKAFASALPFRVKASSFPGRNYVIKAQSDYQFVMLHFPGLKREDVSKLDSIPGSLDLRLEYESFYGERFELDTRE